MHQYIQTDDGINAAIYDFANLSSSIKVVKATKEETSTYRTLEEQTPHQRPVAYEETRNDVEENSNKVSNDSFQIKFVASGKSMSKAIARRTNLSTEKSIGASSESVKKNCVMNKCLNTSKAQKIPLSNKMQSIALKMQKEGKERREQIEQAMAKKIQDQQRNYKTISAKEASNLYHRGMALKLRLEQRRKEESLYRYNSPLLNPLIVVEENASLPRSTSTRRAPRASSVPTMEPKTLEQKESTKKGDQSQMMSPFTKKSYTPNRTRSSM